MEEVGREGRLEIRNPKSLLVTVIGFGMIGVAAFVMAVPLLSDESSVPFETAVVLAGMFFVPGFVLASFRSGLWADPASRRVSKWWGFTPLYFGPRLAMGEKIRRFEELDQVCITRETRRRTHGNFRSPYTVYPVRVEGPQERLTVREPTKYPRSRRLAERIAKATGLPLVDASSNTPVVRQAEHLDESLRDRVRRTGIPPERPHPPRTMRAVVNPRGLETEIIIPPSRFTRVHGLILAAQAVLATVFVVFDVWIALVIPALVTWIALHDVRHRWRLVVSRERLKVEKRGALFTRRTSLDIRELEEVFLETRPGKGLVHLVRPEPSGPAPPPLPSAEAIVCRSDTKTVRIAFEAPYEEMKYIHDLLLWRLTE